MTTPKPALPEPVPPNAEGSTTCIVRWMVTTRDGLWLGAWDKEAFAAYTQAAIDAAVAEARAVPALTFDAFRAANVARCVKWHPEGIASWSPSDWLTAVTGELGELASLLKMRNRERDGLPGNKFSPTQKQIADELADVLTYLDLLADVLGVDLGRAAVEKFNEVSERVGFSDRIAIIASPSPAEQPKPAVLDRAAPASEGSGGDATEASLSDTKPLDDPRLQQLFGDAIEGALAFGYQGENAAPPGHWLERFWHLGRAEAEKTLAATPPPMPARLNDQRIVELMRPLADDALIRPHVIAAARAVIAEYERANGIGKGEQA